ncbi:hypothetical protein BDZ89DRAFT_1024372 [Hymenopellis radicata]|nr:hypothetical protein BDZ89DRAFT_1024372 [Hymenopellis radicata]
MFADPCVPAERQPNRTTRVATLLKGNDAPHDAERAQLRTFLDGAQGDLAKYDEKLELLLKDVNTLREECDKLHSHIEDARTLLRPIRALSDDLLHEIFAHCVPEWGALGKKLLNEPDSKHSSLNSRNVPWTLSHVCRRWRRVALSAPRLWSTIIFTSPAVQTKKKAGSRTLDRLNKFCYNLGLFMSRSGNVDLSVALTLALPEDGIMPDMMWVLLAVGATRWRHFQQQWKRVSQGTIGALL